MHTHYRTVPNANTEENTREQTENSNDKTAQSTFPSNMMIRFILTVSLLLCLVAVTFSQTEAQECAADGSCTKSTVVSDDDACRDHEDSCEQLREQGECLSNAPFMFESCSKTCGVCFGGKRQRLGKVGSTTRDQVISKLQETRDYVEKFLKNETMKSVWKLCANSLSDSQCATWAAQGECDVNPGYMRLSCAAACQTCEYMDIRTRCPMEDATENVWEPGDLQKFFVNLTTKVNHDFDVTILSEPPAGAWVVTIDNFLSEEEANRLIQLGKEKGYERSFGVGGVKDDGSIKDVVSGSRTSKNSWCQGDCFKDETAQTIVKRIADLTSTPHENQEHFQLLSYDVGQFYTTHHDYIDVHTERQPGVRILTVFLYLNTVEAGGGTNFPSPFNITVEPKLGTALIWPSVLDEDPHMIDERTRHQALPVEEGHKYAANAWIHQRNYKAAHANNCQ